MAIQLTEWGSAVRRAEDALQRADNGIVVECWEEFGPDMYVLKQLAYASLYVREAFKLAKRQRREALIRRRAREVPASDTPTVIGP
jgi:hypothetical protein